jgi:hypothetical protein
MSPLFEGTPIHRTPRLEPMLPPAPLSPPTLRAPPCATRPASLPAPAPDQTEAAALAETRRAPPWALPRLRRCRAVLRPRPAPQERDAPDEAPFGALLEPFPLVRRKQRLASVPAAAATPEEALAEPRDQEHTLADPAEVDLSWRWPFTLLKVLVVLLGAWYLLPDNARVAHDLLSGLSSAVSAGSDKAR